MWKEISFFELRYQLRQPLFAGSALVFFLLAVALASSDVGTDAGNTPGTTLRNAPTIIVGLMPVLSLLGLFVITAFVASSALRDFDRRSDMLFFTKPLSKIDYLGGRFAGSMMVSLLILLVAVLGLAVGNFVPWQPADRLGPFSISPYLFGLGVIVIPNLLLMGALFFALAIWSRRLTVTYLCVVFFIGMQDAVEVVAMSLDSRALGSLLEPSGIVALETVARYWTIAEQNTRLPELGGVLVANRLLWLGLAFLVLAVSIYRFDFTSREPRPKEPRKSLRKADSSPQASRHGDDAAQHVSSAMALPNARREFSVVSRWRQLLRQTRLEVSEVVLSTPFLTLLAFGLIFVIAYSFVAGMDSGTPSYPLTHLMLQAIGIGARISLLAILVFYAGELVFSQRSLNLSEVYDALPIPNWMFLVAKLTALVSVAGVSLLVSALSTVVVQLGKGFPRLEPGLYVKGLIVIAWPLLLLAVLAIFLQVLVNHKLWGLLLMTVALLLRVGLPRLGLENNLYLYGSFPAITYSEINGYGHQAESFLWFMAYWSCGALVLLAVALLLWPRGTEVSIRGRLAIARQRLSKPALGVLAIGVLGMAAAGSWIFYNGHLRNEYRDRERIVQRLADYEKEFRKYRDVALPRVTSVFAEVDIYPNERQVGIRGRYRLENQDAEPVRVLPITLSPRWVEGVLRVYGGVTLELVGLPEHKALIEDEALGFYVFELAQPLLEGDAIDFEFTMSVDHEAFSSGRHNNLVVENGTFFDGAAFFPFVGYARGNQLLRPAERRKRGLPPVELMAGPDDAAARDRNYFESDWIRFEAIVSTRADQIAITQGHLEREWTDGDRRYFHYKASTPINLFLFSSGAYEVVRDRWEDIDIEVYFHPDHGFNIERFVEVTKRSLAYMTANFGPYPHSQLRIVEIPGYDGKIAFAFSQVIAYSEAWSFTADLDAGELDWLTGVLAHEVSHQWWNHQVAPGDVQGATLLGESLAQYSAMMVLEKMYGPEMVRHFLKFHLDQYLTSRGREKVEETPLSRVQQHQGYIHYSKASLAFYALKDQIGEESLNQALRGFLEAYALEGPPYATARDLLTYLREAMPPKKGYLIEDLFETITLFDNRLVGATFAEQADGTFIVELETSSKKLRGDGHGTSIEMAIDDWVDIGVFGEQLIDGSTEETVLVLEKRRIQSSEGRFTFVVDQRPLRAGIDPYRKLIDRDSGDNVRTFAELSGH